ncbi:MAG TPA: cation diffusion facilitator family transporter [Anaerolineales bacterium]|nr:cation diffusion facilitator family transporter [Anaerolineales bacterium]
MQPAEEHNHNNEHEHEHNHGHDYDYDHRHPANPIIAWLQHLFMPHSHGHQQAALDPNLATDRGMWALKISLAGLLITAVFQVFIVSISGSVALLADTIHNFSDALTAIPLGLAFWLSRRARNHRYTYGYGRAEDIAGVVIVLMIAFSAGEAIYQAVLKIINPQPITNIGWVAAAGIIGFFGNELVAIFRIRIGKEIGSAALVADGYHARTDGFTSLAVLAGAVGVWLGFPLLDPIVGLGIGVAILGIVWKSAREMWHRMMDAVDPEIYDEFKHTASHVPGVLSVHSAAIRWLGHRLYGEMHITVNCQQTTLQSHFIAEEVRHRLFHELPALVEMIVHTDPCECDGAVVYHPTKHHNFIAVAD